jgi:hypothetical protein
MVEGEALDIDLLAASLRADAGDTGAFAETLAAKLEEALPSRTKVKRARRGMFGPKVVRAIAVDYGGERLELTRSEAYEVQTWRSRVSGGIVLKSEPIETDEWLQALGQALATEAQRSAQTRQALERLLMN